MSDWDILSVGNPVLSFFEGNGLGAFGQKIIDETDAETVDDLKLMDAGIVEKVIQATGMKLVSAKKFRMAIAELRGESPGADPPQTSHASSPQAPASGYPQRSEMDKPVAVDAGRCQPTAVAGEVSLGAVTDTPQLKEYIVVCIDRSGSMATPFHEVTLNAVQGVVSERTRMEAVKAMFYAFRDRADCVGKGTHHMGLVQFDEKIERLLDLTPQLDKFEAIVDDIEKRGMTAIYSSIVEAVDMLAPYFVEVGQVDLRVLVLTDGQNNTGANPETALRAVNRIGAVVDAIIVGDRPDANLRKIVTSTGGECYQIQNLGDGFELLEAEGVVSLRARRDWEDKPPFEPRPEVEFTTIEQKTITPTTAVKRAPKLTKDFASKSVVSTPVFLKSIRDSGSQSSTSNTGVLKRVFKEISQIDEKNPAVWLHSGEGIHIFPAPDDVRLWRVLIEGPAGSPFDKGVFVVNVRIPNDYPFKPPTVVFETPIYHCNVNDSGSVCLDILEQNWSPSLSVPKALETLRMMMKTPDTDNALRQWIAELTIAFQRSSGTDTRYFDNAREHTAKEASMTVDEWKSKWGC